MFLSSSQVDDYCNPVSYQSNYSPQHPPYNYRARNGPYVASSGGLEYSSNDMSYAAAERVPTRAKLEDAPPRKESDRSREKEKEKEKEKEYGRDRKEHHSYEAEFSRRLPVHQLKF